MCVLFFFEILRSSGLPIKIGCTKMNHAYGIRVTNQWLWKNDEFSIPSAPFNSSRNPYNLFLLFILPTVIFFIFLWNKFIPNFQTLNEMNRIFNSNIDIFISCLPGFGCQLYDFMFPGF